MHPALLAFKLNKQIFKYIHTYIHTSKWRPFSSILQRQPINASPFNNTFVTQSFKSSTRLTKLFLSYTGQSYFTDRWDLPSPDSPSCPLLLDLLWGRWGGVHLPSRPTDLLMFHGCHSTTGLLPPTVWNQFLKAPFCINWDGTSRWEAVKRQWSGLAHMRKMFARNARNVSWLSQCVCWHSSQGTPATHQQSGPKDLNTQDFCGSLGRNVNNGHTNVITRKGLGHKFRSSAD